MLGHDPYQRKSIPQAVRFLSVFWGESNEMNASARREDLPVCPGCDHTMPRGLHRAVRSSALGGMLLTGLVCGGPFAAPAQAADWLSASRETEPPAASAPAPLAAPLPPLPEGEEKMPQSAAAQSAAAATAAGRSRSKTAPKAPPADTTLSATAAATWKSLTAWASPATTERSPAAGSPVKDDAPPRPDRVTAPVSPAPVSAAESVRPGNAVGRFDPEIGPAGHSVSDAAGPAVQPAMRPAVPRVMERTESVAEPEQSLTVTDEPVSLVSWLSSYASGGHGSANPCPDICLGNPCCPTWEAQIDALFLWQGNIQSRPLYVDSVTNATVLDANQLYAPAAIAPRYALTYHRDDCRAIEVNYFQVWGFNAQQLVGPQTDAVGDGTFAANNLVGPDYNQVSGALATSSANIQSLEVNLRHTDGGMIEWISGFRWLQWGQNLTLADTITQGDVPVGGDVASIDTLNNLYGWQWGGDMMLWNAGRWLRVNGIAKAGVYYNHQAAQNTFYTDFSNPDVNVASANDTVSFVGETGVNASLALTNWLSWRAGYTFFWLGGMATPARQLGLTDINANTTSVNTNGSVFLHGVNTGLEARW